MNRCDRHISCVTYQGGGPENWLHHTEHPVHAYREQGDCNRCGADGEQAKRKCLLQNR